jgi:hypothetical protein
MKSGSRESFQVSVRCGWSPNARQIRDTAVCVSPTSPAIDRVDQCVASFGAVSSVLTITSSTCASLIVRGRPGRGSSVRPSRRSSPKRLRHFRAVAWSMSRRSAISVFFRPSAASNTIRERNASACALDRRRAQRSNCSRSPSSSTTATATGFGITEPYRS